MNKRSLDDLPRIVAERLPHGATGRLLVAFSGGLDSTVLVHALAGTMRADVRAVHINHGLHAEAARWQQHCERVASELGIAFDSRSVSIALDAEEGIEAAARHARYGALRELLQPGETLLTAHHADDQLETVLLALLRGSGVDGLSAMRPCRRFGQGWHLRPLLEFTRGELAVWARANGLTWLDDPSNASARFDRNYLRMEVAPALQRRWPSASHSAARTVSHLAEAADLLEDLAAIDLARASAGACLKVSVLRELTARRRRNLLRSWLKASGARPPSTRKLAALEHDMLCAEDDRVPCVEWEGVEVRRHRDLLYCMPPLPNAFMEFAWDWRQPVPLTAAPGVLRAEFTHGSGLKRAALPERLHVRLRRGGERLRLPGRAHRSDLKKLLQEADVLPWWRERLPLVFAGEQLIAVADLWIDANFAAGEREESVRIVWDGRPPLDAFRPNTE
jgi:tRNA(Ile)-lysidine synthase